jgi:uncharacterized membrane protein
MQRYLTIDKLRGVSFIFMFIFHIFSIYDYSTLFRSNISGSNTLQFIGLVRNIFIILAGISMTLSFKNSKIKNKNFYISRVNRSAEIMANAVIISVLTHILTPDLGVKFGILHFIGLGTLITSPLVQSELLTIIALVASVIFKFPVINKYIDTITGASIRYSTVDWFPLNKNLPLLIFGILLGQTIFNYVHEEKMNENENENILSWIGKNSLPLYTLHFVIFCSVYFFLASLV